MDVPLLAAKIKCLNRFRYLKMCLGAVRLDSWEWMGGVMGMGDYVNSSFGGAERSYIPDNSEHRDNTLCNRASGIFRVESTFARSVWGVEEGCS